MPIPGFVLLLGGGYALLRTREPRARADRRPAAPPRNPIATPVVAASKIEITMGPPVPTEPIPPTPKIS